jgi:hypothetical protein
MRKLFSTFREQKLEFRFEFFNLFNHPNLQVPVTKLSSGSFGQIQSASGPRIMQLAAKLPAALNSASSLINPARARSVYILVEIASAFVLSRLSACGTTVITRCSWKFTSNKGNRAGETIRLPYGARRVHAMSS